MTRYFVAGNVWLVLALLMFVGRTYERSSPTRYSIFHGGQWFSAEAYTALIALLIAISTFFFIVTWKTRNKGPR